MEAIGELRGEVVEHVGRVAESREKNHWLAGAAPVEHLELDLWRDGNHPDAVV